MKIIDYKTIKSLEVNPSKYLDWIDHVLRHRDEYEMPTKTKIHLNGSDYMNVMPSSLPGENALGVKMINRNEKRRNAGGINLDSQIFLYDYENCNLEAILDGNYITTIRTAAVASHTVLNMCDNYKTIAMIGLGNIANAIGEILFPTLSDKELTIKVYKYKDHAEKFINRFSHHSNLHFVICDSYGELMADSDVILSCVSFAETDFCDESIYKKGCVVIPVHMRGFMECDKTFDHIIASDMERIKEFANYSQMKKLSSTDDVLQGKINVKANETDRVIIYNLGLSITDIFFAKKLMDMLPQSEGIEASDLAPKDKYYV